MVKLYHYSYTKLLFDYFFSILGLVITSPLFLLIYLLIEIENNGPVFFIQNRVGKNGKVFSLIKFRTMRTGSENQRWRYMHINEADGPVFKIVNDPRFTKLGKFLARCGFDELPQLFNVIKGEMSLVGPRPFPTYEAKKLKRKDRVRELVKPGITSSWVIRGAHSLTFKQWMRLDRDYVHNATLVEDLKILIKTFIMVIKMTLNQILGTG